MVRGLLAVLAVLWIVLPGIGQTLVVIETEFGEIVTKLEDTKAPRTVANFLRYVDSGRYTNGMFHRTVRSRPDNQPQSAVKIDVIQAGANASVQAQAFPPVTLERTSQTGLKHIDGAISMARMAPDSATSDFFICIGNQPELDFGGVRNPDLQGFAVFGRVIEGMDVVRKIHESAAGPSSSTSGVASGNQRLTPPVRILAIRRR